MRDVAYIFLERVTLEDVIRVSAFASINEHRLVYASYFAAFRLPKSMPIGVFAPGYDARVPIRGLSVKRETSRESFT